MEKRTFTYYAYISYKHGEDTKYAKWIQKKLDNYRLPTQLKERKQAEKHNLFYPTFIDDEYLQAGPEDELFRQHLAQSKYLIVICSRNSRREHFYVDKEIRLFLDTGHTVDYIIPLIVDEDASDPVAECFPPALQEIHSRTGIIGNSFAASDAKTRCGRMHDTFLKIVAMMLEVETAEVKRLDLRRQMLTAIACFAVVFSVLLGSGIYYYNHVMEHVSYYGGYVLEQNVPRGIYPLSPKALVQHGAYYEIVVQDGKIRSVEHKNNMGIRVAPPDTILNEGAAFITYTYKDDELTAAEFYSETGHLIVCHEFSDEGRHVRLTRGIGTDAQSYLSADGKPSAVSKYVQNFDEHGRITTRMFARGEAFSPCVLNDALADNMGIEGSEVQRTTPVYGYEFQYDALGQIEYVSYLGTADGTSPGMIETVNAMGYQYNGVGQLCSQYYLDVYGRSVNGPDGWSNMVRTYQDVNTTEERYYTADDQFLYLAQMIANAETGLQETLRYSDEEGKPILGGPLKVYGMRTEYEQVTDGLWREKSVTLLGKNGRTAYYSKWDYSSYEMEYEGNTVRISFFGTAEQPTAATRVVERKYDALYGNLTDEEWSGTDMPAPVVVREYDSSGREVKCSYFAIGDSGRKPICAEEGYASREYVYKDGYLYEEYYYDVAGRLTILPSIGAAGMRMVRNSEGNIMSLSYLGTDREFGANAEGGNLILSAKGYATAVYTYHKNGLRSGVTYLNALGIPVSIEDGYAHYEVTYDDMGNLTEKSLYALEGTEYVPAVSEEMGWSKLVQRFDEFGNLTLQEYYGLDGVPVANRTTGFARYTAAYDANGFSTLVEYYTAINGNVVPCNSTQKGYARKVLEHDVMGNVTLLEYYAVHNGNYVPYFYEEQGCAKFTQQFDEQGKLLCAEYFGVDGDAFVSMNNTRLGYAKVIAEYDAEGRTTMCAYYSADNGELRPAKPEGKDYAKIEYQYDSDGTLQERRMYSFDGTAYQLIQ